MQFNSRQKLTCQMSGEERQTPWEHGSTILKAIKSVEIEGLTGPIRSGMQNKRPAGQMWPAKAFNLARKAQNLVYLACFFH